MKNILKKSKSNLVSFYVALIIFGSCRRYAVLKMSFYFSQDCAVGTSLHFRFHKSIETKYKKKFNKGFLLKCAKNYFKDSLVYIHGELLISVKEILKFG